MSDRYFAFISYAMADKEWVATLQRDLEQCLDHYARTVDPNIARRVFLDQVDLQSGQTWIDQFQEAAEKSERLILVVSPEALESAWVRVEWQSFFTRRPKDVFSVLVADVDLPAFLKQIQAADFDGLEDAAYGERLTQLFGDLLRRSRRDPPPMPDALVGPSGLLNESSLLLERRPRKDRFRHDALGAWLAKVRGDHQWLVPYFQQRAALGLLDRVYVPLELRFDVAERLEWMRKPVADGDEATQLAWPLTIHQVLDLDPTKHPSVGRRWVVLGDPGAGKTTLLRHFASELARETPSRWIPIFESLPRLMREPQWLLDRFERQMRRADQPSDGLASILDQAGQEGRLLVLLDGFDEVPCDDREDAEALLRQVSTRWPSTPILVTSRPIGCRRPGAEFQELELLPLDAKRRREFLARWLGRATGTPDPDRAADAAAGLEADASLRELASNPLYLTLMALLIEQGTSPAANRAQFYDQVFDLLLEGKHRLHPWPINAKLDVRKVLRHLAFEMTRSNRDAEPVEQLEARLYKQELANLREPLECVPRWRRSLRPFLDDLAERTGILGEHDGPGTEWRFWHRGFREALAAEELAHRHKTEGQAKILDHAREIAGDEGRWAEPYALLTGRVDEPDTLAKALVAENSALGLRALATAQTLADETIVEVLELSDDWQKRVEVYLTLPDKLDDPTRTLALVDRLRQRTRNGNDLYHLELTAVLVAQRWPDAARAVDELLDRLYDHIPAPPAELFTTVETRDGRVDLWCEIPAGRFLMGSPNDEEGSSKQEGPRHEVTIESSFRLAAVMVTQAQYAVFDPDHRSADYGVDQRPVDTVSLYEAVAFCRWLGSQAATQGARLPSEEEWEYACRAGTKTRFWIGDSEEDLARTAWFGEEPITPTHPVGEKLANPWGLYDIHGNVLEWTTSPWTEDYSGREKGIAHDPWAVNRDNLRSRASRIWHALPPPAQRLVIRGGSYSLSARDSRSALRSSAEASLQSPHLGFRVLIPSVLMGASWPKNHKGRLESSPTWEEIGHLYEEIRRGEEEDKPRSDEEIRRLRQRLRRLQQRQAADLMERAEDGLELRSGSGWDLLNRIRDLLDDE